MDYLSHRTVWEKYATIRSRPRRIVKPEETRLDFFPRARQLLCLHPLVRARGEGAIRFILVQTANRFMHDIAILETEVVNKGALMIANNKFDFCRFPKALCHDALSIIIDEAYHAYVAIDYLMQMEKMVDFPLLYPPEQTAVLNAIIYVKEKLAPNYHDAFELIAVCIGEHVLTKELLSINSEKSVAPSFESVMADHVFDEGRHASMFDQVLKYFWSSMPLDYQCQIGKILPEFLREYLRKDVEISYDRQILTALNFSKEQVNQIIAETYIQACDLGMNERNPIVANLLNLLQRCFILEHEDTATAFLFYNLAA